MRYVFPRRLILSGLVVLTTGIFASAQSTITPPAATSRVAIVYSEKFADQKLGITRFLAVQKKLDQEFGQTRNDLQKLKTQMDGIEKEIRDVPRELVDQKTIADKAEQFDRLKREFGFRSNEANTAIGLRFDKLVKPVSDDIAKALGEFAKKNSIDIIIDASKSDAVFVFSNAVDVTSQFVAYFNAQTAKP